MMRAWGKLLVAVAAPLLLTGCLWGPGKFTSDLALRKDGGFTLAYKGEIVLQSPDAMGGDAAGPAWSDRMARCRSDNTTETVTDIDEPVATDEDNPPRPCSAAEIAKLKAAYEASAAEKIASKRKDSEQMA